jgi:hypothetical protein
MYELTSFILVWALPCNQIDFLTYVTVCFRNDEYEGESKNGPPETYDGPAGMNPDGIIESNWDEVVDNFDNMKLKEELLRGIYAYGFEKPSAIQQRAIMPCVKGLDVIAQAQSGAHVLSYLTSLGVSGFDRI